MADQRTIVFFPEGAYGPTNNCVGIGRQLQRNGHRVVFIVEESFAVRLEVIRERGGRILVVGPEDAGIGDLAIPIAAGAVPDPVVRALAEPLVPALIAAQLWHRARANEA
ncbi:MAG: hypothetical protein V4515_08465 [Chloroflexota bacterium]